MGKSMDLAGRQKLHGWLRYDVRLLRPPIGSLVIGLQIGLDLVHPGRYVLLLVFGLTVLGGYVGIALGLDRDCIGCRRRVRAAK